MSCSRPYFSDKYKNLYGRPIPIACRTCECCRADRAAQWTERAKYEFSRFGCGSFVTFTYDDDNVPISETSDRGRQTLNYLHYHKYIDSIRHRSRKIFPKCPQKFYYSRPDFTYIGCAEYGDKFERPHYHILFFGLDYGECEKFLKRSWKYGSIDVKPIKPGAYSYVLKYIQKQIYGDMLFDTYYSKGVLPPKLFFSRGFGRGLFFDNSESIQEFGYIKKGSRQVNVPSYYLRKIMNWSVDEIIRLDSIKMEQDFANYRHYQSLGGSLKYNDWKVRNRVLREYKLRSKKFKRCGDAILSRMYKVDPYRPYMKQLMLDLSAFDLVDEFKQYGDLVPF